MASQFSNLLSFHSHSHSFIDRTQSNNKHTFVGKTASSPIPEHETLHVPARMLVKGELSAPAPASSSNYQQFKHRSTLAKSDEDEQESQEQTNDFNHTNERSKPLGQFYSLRYRNIKPNQNSEDVSQYLGVDANSTPGRNTFLQPNTGMKDVPKWLKNLRLHKYDVFFSQMTYDQMMNLTMEQLKKLNITDGACAKILLNIKKLKERSILLKQCLTVIDNGQIELSNVIGQLTEILSTPIRSKQLELENNSEEDLPELILQILQKIYQQLTTTSPPDICNSLLGLFDRCYKHEAFIDNQRVIVLQWRGRLSAMLQSLGKIEYKTIQSTFSHTPQRRSIKSSIRPMKSSLGLYHSNHSTNSVPLMKFNSEPQHNSLMNSNLIRRPNKSPINIYSTTEETNEVTSIQTSFSCITSTPQRNNGAYLVNNQHQALTRKASIDPYSDNNSNNKTKLCKTISDPSKIRFYNPTQMNHMQFSSIRSQQQNLFPTFSTPYSQQTQFPARSPPTTTTDTSTSSIKECYSDNEHSDFYGNNNNNNNNATSISSASDTNELDNTDDQRQNDRDLESFYRDMTESTINDDVNDSLVDHKDEIMDVSNLKQSLNNSTDIEQ
ncbi:unnamed protein product [Adineta steineri]|uniref:SAM domain-containing protein n=1 Tax=Adineta steineri TaxID=433720 RepID=A0A814PVL0_9BILA|nr:unnamed protein product [Adineta steineri]CAF1111469.1 unnamed protein product [Adineta steineri]